MKLNIGDDGDASPKFLAEKQEIFFALAQAVLAATKAQGVMLLVIGSEDFGNGSAVVGPPDASDKMPDMLRNLAKVMDEAAPKIRAEYERRHSSGEAHSE